MILINLGIRIPKREIAFKFGLSSGPGGQNVNKVETKVTLLFHVESSSAFNPSQKENIQNYLKTRINKLGYLRVTASKFRSQQANRELVISRFIELINESLAIKKKRKKKHVSNSQKQKRLETKKKRSNQKQLRSKLHPDSC